MIRHVRQFIIVVILCAAGAVQASAGNASPPAENQLDRDKRMAWWREARFGMFIHWGLYAVPAGEWNGATQHGEWIMHTAKIPVEEYERLRQRFNPTKFNADEWVRIAKAAGMRYIVITSKHHDGFCLFDSAHTDYDVMSTPFQRDILRELAEACRREGLKICWYHSIMDWHHPDYLPRRDWEKRSAEGADYRRYVQHLKAQVRELLTNYGDVGVMWFDGEWEDTWNHEFGQDLYDFVRRLQPSIIVNNRVDKGRGGMGGMSDAGFAGDYGTPEQEIPATGLPGVDWETCMTMNDHWGYNEHDKNFKSAETLIRMLADIASKGGNFLLNVGPTAEGAIPPESVERLAAISRWMKVNGESIHGTLASPFKELAWGRCTLRYGHEARLRTDLYLHVFDWPKDGRVIVPAIDNAPESAWLLSDPQRAMLKVVRERGDLIIEVPPSAPDPVDSVVVLRVLDKPTAHDVPTITARQPATADSRSAEAEPRARPTPEQVAWHDCEIGMFIHFAPNTWTDREYDDLSLPLEKFNPARLDTEQWADAATAMGAKYVILVAKHAGGFCLWQTDTTDYGVKNTPWRSGKGDVLRDLSESCRKRGLHLGVYLSPCDKKHGAALGGKCPSPESQEAYNQLYRKQLTEVLSRYGEMFEVWFDGSVVVPVGDILQRYAPRAMVFQGPHATIRWVGNEDGVAPHPAWNSLSAAHAKTGEATAEHGDPDGAAWLPLECDARMRNTWFWNTKNAGTLKSVDQLMDMYYRSVGHGAVLLLNHTPDTSGLIPEADVRRGAEFAAEVRRRFGASIAETRGDGELVELTLPDNKPIDHVMTMEDIAQGERVREYVIEGFVADEWKVLAKGTAIGHKRIDRFDPIAVTRVRLRVISAAGRPVIWRLAVLSVGR